MFPRKCRSLLFLSLVLFAAAGSLSAQSYMIGTYAGADPFLDGNLATSARLYHPEAVLVDRSNTIYIADNRNNRIRKLTPDGKITTIAGTGVAGFSGDGGPAEKARLNAPLSLVMDKEGNLLFTDANNNRVRKIAKDGTISTVAGGAYGYAGDGGPAASANFRYPIKLALDAEGNLYISELSNHRIRKINTAGTIQTVAGNGQAGFSGDNGPATAAQLSSPRGIAFDPQGNLLIADTGNSRVRRVTPEGQISTIYGSGDYGYWGDGGSARMAAIGYVTDVAVNAQGDVYLSIWERVCRISGGIIRTVAGSPLGGKSGFSGDGGKAVDASFAPNIYGIGLGPDGSLYVADSGNYRLRKVAPDGIVTTIAGGGHVPTDGVPATLAPLLRPHGLTVDASGTVYISEEDNRYVRKVSPSGLISTVAGTGRTSGNLNVTSAAMTMEFSRPSDVAVDTSGNVLVVDNWWHRVFKVSPSGSVTTLAGTGTAQAGGDGGPADKAFLNYPQGLALDRAGNVYIADTTNDQIRRVSPNGTIERVAGQNQNGFRGDNGPALNSLLNVPADVAIDPAGAIIIADTGNRRLRKITPEGVITTIAGNGNSSPIQEDRQATATAIADVQGVAVDAQGYIYFSAAHRVRRISPNGVVTTIAGTGGPGFSGDGGPALLAEINDPHNLAVDSAGRIYVAEAGNHRVRVLTPLVPATVAIVRGNSQTGNVNTLLPIPLTVRVADKADIPIAGMAVAFAVASGTARLSAASATTGADGQASITVTLGATAGSVTVTATAAGLPPVTFTLAATGTGAITAPTPAIGQGAVRGAGLMFAPGLISPNGIISIFGSEFAPAGTFRQAGASDIVNGLVTTNLDGVCVQIGTTRAPVFLVTPTQINLQVPTITTFGTVAVQVIRNCGGTGQATSNSMNVTIQSAAPEFFSFKTNADLKNPVAALNAVTGQYIGDPAQLDNPAYAPAKPGDYVTAYATGFGLTTPRYSAGQLATDAASITGAVRVRLGQINLAASDILYAGVTPANAGLYQLSFRIPDATPAGDLPLVVTIGTVSSPEGSYITVAK